MESWHKLVRFAYRPGSAAAPRRRGQPGRTLTLYRWPWRLGSVTQNTAVWLLPRQCWSIGEKALGPREPFSGPG